MYRRSDKSESPTPSRTPITGQQDNLPREGIISKKRSNSASNGDTREHPSVNRNRIPDHRKQRKTDSENFATRVIPSTRGLTNSTNQRSNTQVPNHNTRQMSQTQRIPYGKLPAANNGGRYPQGVRGTASATMERPRVPRRKPTLKRRLLRFFHRYRGYVTVALVCLLFLCVSIPLTVFAINNISLKDEPASQTPYETSEINPSLNKDTQDSSSANGNAVIDTEPNTEQGSEPTEDDVTDSDTSELPPEETTTDEGTADPNEGKFPVTIYFYDREAITCYTEPATLRQILANEGCVLKDSDRPSIDLDTMIKYESWIMINSVSYKQVTESEIIPFSTETYETDTVPRGTVKTVSWGVNGSKEKVYTVEYLNGKEVDRTFQYEYIASYPSNQIDYYGVGGTFTASDGTVYSYSYRVEVRATYYNIHGTTYTGLPTGNNIVAVDPNVFPLGTEMYVINDKYDMGYRIAADIGGAVKGNLIDLWMDETNPYYTQFAFQGVANMTAYILG